ncbi:MAG: hypothetical protein LBR07_10150 [Puniceicoccales bacterium]|jgi:hypothetical protein|nr:hypothetical protein [Puniceicoccales bacterium]
MPNSAATASAVSEVEEISARVEQLRDEADTEENRRELASLARQLATLRATLLEGADGNDDNATGAPLPPVPPPPPAPVPPPRTRAPATFRPRPVSAWRRRLAKFGGTSFAISIAVHAVLLAAALLVVITTVIPAEKEPSLFRTGTGGGDGGRRTLAEHCVKAPPARPVATPPRPKLTVKGAESALSVSALPVLDSGLLRGAAAAGALSKGGGGGTGGGLGGGNGLGSGGRAHVGRFVMGVEVKARKIAVYLDDSGSMQPFLPRVKEEIYAQFPDADIFEHKNIFITVSANRIVGGVDDDAPRPRRKPKPRKSTAGSATFAEARAEQLKLSDDGKRIFAQYAANFDHGSIGAWTDIMMRENCYDALVVFSDFQDGVRDDGLPPARRSEQPWTERWVAHFSRAKPRAGTGGTGGAAFGLGAPRLYLFSIQVTPQPIWQQCVRASGGEIKMMPELRQTVAPVKKRARKRAAAEE